MKPVHINAAESIIDPFWDPEISSLDKWTVIKEAAGNILIQQTWCMVSFKWTDAPKGSEAISFYREYTELCVVKEDTLIISAALIEGTVMKVYVYDGNESILQEFICRDDKKHEYKLNIKELKNITAIKINVSSSTTDAGSGWFNWIGLADSKLLSQYLEVGGLDADTWNKHLKPLDYKPSFEPAYGILLDDEDISVLREMTEETDESNNPLFHIKSYENLTNPEMHMNEYVNFLQDTRYNRERDEGNYLLKKGENAAVAGIILKDPVLLRLAARYALTIASCDNWDDGFICDFQTSSFNHRCFVQSLCLYECALILDLAGEFFTDVGRDYVLRKMAEEGVGVINFNTWKYEYIFHCNQMAWFSPGRMYGYAVLQKHYPRIEPYMDLALDDVIENINNTIEDDGGYVEGPGYFSCVGRDGLLALYIYARARNIAIEELIPPVLLKTADFGEVLESTDKNLDFINICDSSLRIKSAFINLYKVHLAFMAYFFPKSVWPEIFHKHVRNYGLGDNPLAWIFYKKVVCDDTFRRKSFIQLGITGHTASVRKGKAGTAKILVIGNKKGAGHTHMDKGSFVYEYGGETFLMDPGVCAYDNPISRELKSPNRHNMLLPLGEKEITNPENPLMCNVIPDAYGDDLDFKSKSDLSKTWPYSYVKWIRSIQSPTPEILIVEDEYELVQGNKVEMILNSPLEISRINKQILIKGRDNCLHINIPDGCKAKIDTLPHPDLTHNRVSFMKNGKRGILRVEMFIEIRL